MNSESSEPLPGQPPESAENAPPAKPAVESAAEDRTVPAEQALDGDAPAPASAAPAVPEPAAPSVEPPPAKPARRKIQIGSRHNKPPAAALKAPKPVEPSALPPDIAADAPAPVPVPNDADPIPTPSVRDPLPDDLEKQLAAAMDGTSIDDLLADGSGESPGATVELESRVQSAVTRIHGDNVFFSLGGRNEGVASLRQFAEPPEIGAQMEVIVKSFVEDDGLYEVLLPGASAHVEDWSDLSDGMMVEARITGANTGGLECKVGGVRGFIPSSQIAIFRVEDYAEFIDQKLLCVVTEVNPKRRNLVLSRRAVLEREKEEARQQLLESLEVGHVAEGIVRKLMDFGAFVDIGGIDGLVHISQLSWDRVSHPSEVLEVGQKIRVKVEKIDLQSGKIGLSYRDLLDHPWLNVEDQFPVDSVVKGTVTRIAKFGAFVKLATGVEGLIHISELSYGRVSNVGTVVSEGQEVDVKVLSIDKEAQRIALSMKAILPEPEPTASASGEPEQEGTLEAERKRLAAQRTQPLKGGVGRDSGGGQFGLKW